MDINREPFDFGHAITHVFKLPGGLAYTFKIALSAGLLLVLVYAIFGRSLMSSYLDLITAAMQLEDPEDTAAVTAMMGQMSTMILPAMAIWLGSWMVLASAETAMHKNAFYEFVGGLFPLRFGIAELRVMLAQLVVGLIGFGVYIGGYLFLAILMVLTALAANLATALGVVVGILAFVGFLVWVVAIFMAFVRLAPAAAMSVRDNEIRTVEGWKITKGRFWPMFGSYLVIGVVGYFATILVFGLCMILMMGSLVNLSDVETMDSEDPTAMFEAFAQAMSDPGTIIGLLVGGTIIMVFSTVWRMAIWGVANYVTLLDTSKDLPDIFE